MDHIFCTKNLSLQIALLPFHTFNAYPNYRIRLQHLGFPGHPRSIYPALLSLTVWAGSCDLSFCLKRL